MAVVTSLGFSLYSTWNGSGVKKATRALDKMGARVATVQATMLAGFMGDKMAVGIATFATKIELALIGIASLAVTSAATVGAALSLIPVIFLGLGAVAAGVSGELAGAWKLFGESGIATMQRVGKVTAPIFQDFLEKATGVVSSIGDATIRVFEAIGPTLNTFTDSVLGFLDILFSGLAEVAIKAAPALDALSGGLLIISQGVVDFFDKLATVAPEAATGLTSLFTGSVNLLDIAADLLVSLTKVGVHALPALGGLFGVFGTIIRDVVIPVFEALIPTFDAIANSGINEALSKLVTAIGPLASAIVGLLGPLAANLLPLVANLFGFVAEALTGAIKLVLPIIEGLSRALTFLGPRGTGAALAMILLGRILTGFMVKSALSAGLAIGRLTALQMLLSGAGRKAMLSQAKAFLVMKLGWIKTAAIAMANAIKMAAAWLIALGPIGIIIAIVAAVVAAVIIFWDKIKAPFIAAWNAILGFFKKFWPVFLVALLGPLGLLIVWIIKNWDKVKAALAAGWNRVKSAAVSVWNAIKSAAVVTWNAIKVGAQAVWNFLKTVWNNIKAVSVAVWNFVKPAWNAFVEWFKRAWKAALAVVAVLIGAWIGIIILAVVFIKKHWNSLVSFFKALWNGLKSFFADVWKGLTQGLVEAWKGIKPGLMSAWDGIKDAWKSAVDGFKAIWDTLKTAFTPVVDAFKDVWKTLKDSFMSVKDTLAGAWKSIKEAVKPLIDMFKNLFGGDEAKKSGDSVKKAGDGVSGTVKSVGDRVSPIVTFLKTAFTVLGKILGFVFNVLGYVFKAIAAVIKFLVPIIQFIVKVIAGIITVVAKIVSVVIKVVAAIINVVVKIVVGIIQFAVGMIRVVINIVNGVRNVISAVTNFIVAAWTWVRVRVVFLWNLLRAAVMVVFNAIRGVIIGVFTAVRDFVLGVWNWIRVRVVFAWNLIKSNAMIIFNAIKNVIMGVWNAVKNAVLTVWNWIRVRVVAYWNAMKLSATIIFNALKAFFSGIWNAIKTAVTTVWNAIKTFLSTVWNGIKTIASAVFNAVKNVLLGVWNSIKTTVTTVWNAIKSFLSGLWNALKASATAVFNGIKSFLSGVWNAIKSTASTVWNAIKSVVTGVWNALHSAIKTVVDKIKAVWDGLKSAAETIWNGIKGIVNGFRDAFKAVKDKIISFVDNITDKWDALKGTAENVWNSIRDMIKTPVKFVIDTVYNNGIVKFWNWVDDKLFGGDHNLDTVSVSKFASGGTHQGHVWGRGTGTSDSVPARLSRGEHVWTAREVAGAGGHGAVARMRSRALHGKPVSMGPGNGNMAFKEGGAWYEDLGSLAKNFFSSVFNGNLGDVITELPKKITEYTTDFAANVKGLDEKTAFQKNFKSKVKAVTDKVLEVMNTVASAFGGGEGGPGDYKAMAAWIKTVVSGTTISSGLRKGDPGYHGKGQAIDMVFSDSSERKGGGKALKAFNAIVATWKNATAELIWDFSPWSSGDDSIGLWNGARHRFNSSSSRMGTHADHIHWASDKGSVGGAIGDLAGVEKWRTTVANVLSIIGVHSKSNIDAVLECIRQESNGNQFDVNNWDSNAKAGTPSKGLMQVIQPTFDAYAGPYKSMGLFNPAANIYAAVKYAMDRYGSGWQAKITAPGGYNTGGFVPSASYDRGGMLQPGWTMAYNGTGRPEPVGHDLVEGGRGDTYEFHFHGPVSDRQTIEDWTVRAVTDAKKKGRLPK